MTNVFSKVFITSLGGLFPYAYYNAISMLVEETRIGFVPVLAPVTITTFPVKSGISWIEKAGFGG